MAFEVPGDLQLNSDRTDVLMVQGIDEIAAAVDTALQIFQGTWRYDLAAGLPPQTTLYSKPADADLWRAAVWERIAGVAGIERPTSVQVSYDRPSRALQVNWSAKTVAGAITSMVSYT